MKIARHTVASIEYRLTDDTGELIDSSEGHAPLQYVHGTEGIVPGLESALEGKGAGDVVDVRVAPEQGYGERDEGQIHAVPRKQFPPGEIKVGMQVQARGQGGDVVLTVFKVEGDVVHLDANHPLAGVPLNFHVKVVDVRTATAEEIAHGHVHGPGGHHHH